MVVLAACGVLASRTALTSDGVPRCDQAGGASATVRPRGRGTSLVLRWTRSVIAPLRQHGSASTARPRPRAGADP